MSILSVFSDLVYPRRCAVCGRLCDREGRHLCAECLMRIAFVDPADVCPRCGRSVHGGGARTLCEDCAGRNAPAFDRSASAIRFEGRSRELVHRFKFSRELSLRDDFVDFMEAALTARFEVAAVDVVVPVPITLLRRWDRGYNQSAVLAAELARRIDRRLEPKALGRTGSPRRQSSLNEEERRENVVGTFAVRRPERLRGRTVLVVDDIMTTGATLSECARVLKLAGADRVWALSLARSVRN